MPSPKVEHLLWLDLETDGSNECENNILEIGCILTDVTGDEVLFEFESVVAPLNNVLRHEIEPVIVEMHEKNGLWADLASPNVPTSWTVERSVIDLLELHGVRKHRVAMAGSGVSHFDARFITEQMPILSRWFKYWQLDMGHVRRFLDFSGYGYVLRKDDQQDEKPHRGLADARLHLAEYRHYQEQFGKAFAALIEQTRRTGMVVDNSLEPVEVTEPDDRPELAAPAGGPSVPERWRSPEH